MACTRHQMVFCFYQNCLNVGSDFAG